MNIEKRLAEHKLSNEREIERRERLVQTYLIIIGFLITFNQNLLAQKFSMVFLILLLISFLIYYVTLTKTKDLEFINFTAILFSLVFSFILAMYILLITTENSDLNTNLNALVSFYSYYIMLSYLVSLSLIFTLKWKFKYKHLGSAVLLYLMLPIMAGWQAWNLWWIILIGLIGLLPLFIYKDFLL